MRSRTRATFVAVVVLAMVAALAPAAFGVNCDKRPDHPQCGGPVDPPSGRISIEVETVGVHELAAPYTWEEGALGFPFYSIDAVGDQLEYVVLVDGATIKTISWEIGLSNSGTTHLDPATATTEYRVRHTVMQEDIVADEVSATFTVTTPADEVQAVAVVTGAELEIDCSEVGLQYSVEDVEGVDGSHISRHVYEGTVTTEMCRWVPVELGLWDVELTPTQEVTRPVTLGASLRDHVPGNWCATSQPGPSGQIDDNSGMVTGRTRGGSVHGMFYLPDGSVGTEQAGICLVGGAGGNTMAVGTTSDFILRTGAHIRLTKDVTQP